MDYVNPSYVLSHKTSADTSAAQRAIIALADEAAKHGPWSKSLSRSGADSRRTQRAAHCTQRRPGGLPLVGGVFLARLRILR